MGAYLSSPITEKNSVDNSSGNFVYGASSMQGWRVSQEDAHNCCPDFDTETNTTLFAVYDGHGGEEVAKYCSLHLPDFIKTMPTYKEGHLPQALEDAFLGFDETLTEEKVITELKQLAGVDEDEMDKEEQEEDAAMLYEEASLPLEDLIARYSAKPDQSRLSQLRKTGKVQSPMIHAKKVVNGEDQDHDGSTVECSAEADSTEADVKMKLEDKLVNGHFDNENNKNLEKEQCEAKASTQKDSIKESGNHENEEIKQKRDNSSSNISSSSNIEDSDHSSTKESVNNSVSCETEKSGVSTTIDGSGDAANCGISTTEGKDSTGISSSSSKENNSNAEVSSTVKPSEFGDSVSEVSTSVHACEEGSSTTGVSTTVEGNSPGGSAEHGDIKANTDNVGAGGSTASTSENEEEPQPCSSSGKSGHSLPAEEDDEEDEDDEDSFDEDEEDEELDSSEEEGEGAWRPNYMDDEEEEGEDEEEDEAVGMACRDGEKEEPGSDSGCTAVVALMRGKELHVANAGDSRCVVCRAGKALDMSIDHKPEDDVERQRIERAGGKVTPDGRVNGGLNLSRAIGDHCYKKEEDLPLKDQMISALPDVKSITLTEEDEFMVLACDGIWNFMTSQEVVDFVRERIENGQEKMSVICEEMFDHCLAPNTMGDGTGCDNMTGIIVNFKINSKNEGQGTAMKRKAESEEAESTDTSDAKRTKSETD